jgi:hypothetical protein
LTGLINCYIMAIPFFRNTLVGDISYSGVFFLGYALFKNLSYRWAIRTKKLDLNLDR